MNPVIIIPTYVRSSEITQSATVTHNYDHMTPLDRPGELVRCLSSLRKLGIDAPIAIMVIAQEGIEHQAETKIRDQAARFPELNIAVVAKTEQDELHKCLNALGFGNMAEGITLAGYGASKNMALAYAASMGYTEVIFIDDDEVVEEADFLEKACYGLGMLTQRGVPILIKSGFYIDKKGSYKSGGDNHWYNSFWNQHKGFDEWISAAMQGPRLSSSNVVCGGCMSIHREAYRRVSFDPWIARGEDLDFLFNVRMYGSEVWFDNIWVVRHLPSSVSKVELGRFSQDIYRWLYEFAKLELSTSQIDLLQINARNFDPYPGKFMDSNLKRNIMLTALLRTIGRASNAKGYYRRAMEARAKGSQYAKDNCAKYFAFQRQWPEVLAAIELDEQLKRVFENAAVVPMTPEQIEAAEMTAAWESVGVFAGLSADENSQEQDGVQDAAHEEAQDGTGAAQDSANAGEADALAEPANSTNSSQATALEQISQMDTDPAPINSAKTAALDPLPQDPEAVEAMAEAAAQAEAEAAAEQQPAGDVVIDFSQAQQPQEESAQEIDAKASEQPQESDQTQQMQQTHRESRKIRSPFGDVLREYSERNPGAIEGALEHSQAASETPRDQQTAENAPKQHPKFTVQYPDKQK